MAEKHSLSQCLQKVGLAVQHLRQLWWWRWRWCISTKHSILFPMLGGSSPTSRLSDSCLSSGLHGDRLLHGSENGERSSTATPTPTANGCGGRRAVVQTSGTTARRLTTGLGQANGLLSGYTI
jgi:hypothetical protein